MSQRPPSWKPDTPQRPPSWKPDTPVAPLKRPLGASGEWTAPSGAVAELAGGLGRGLAKSVGADPSASIPGMVYGVGKNMVTGTASTLGTIARRAFIEDKGLGPALVQTGAEAAGGIIRQGGDAVDRAYQGIRQRDPRAFGEGVGEVAGLAAQAALIKRSPQIAKTAAAPIQRAAPGMTRALERSAQRAEIRALAPVSEEMTAAAQQIAGDILRRGGISAKTGARYDMEILRRFDQAREALKRAEDLLPEGDRIAMGPDLAKVDAAMERLTVPGMEAGGAVPQLSGYPEAVTALRRMRRTLEALPEHAPVRDYLRLKRQFDRSLEVSGAHRAAMSDAAAARHSAKKGIVDMMRGRLNDAYPELAEANAQFTIFKTAQDIVRKRLGVPGKTDIRLATKQKIGRVVGSPYDDVIAMALGYAVGGPEIAAAAETLNILRQARGVSNIRANVTQRMADLTRSMIPAKPRRPGFEPSPPASPPLLPQYGRGDVLASSGQIIRVPPGGFGELASRDLAAYLDQELRAGRMTGTLENAWQLWHRGLVRGPDGRLAKRPKR